MRGLASRGQARRTRGMTECAVRKWGVVFGVDTLTQRTQPTPPSASQSGGACLFGSVCMPRGLPACGVGALLSRQIACACRLRLFCVAGSGAVQRATEMARGASAPVTWQL